MSTQTWKTTIGVAGAAGLLVAAVWLTGPNKGGGVGAGGTGTAAERGTALTPDLTDPRAVTSLEVVSWDDQTARPRAFKVAFEGGRWVVPSAFNYPVDATQTMGLAASGFVGLLKDRVVSDRASDHQRLGVIAPDDVSSAATTGRGTRVTMRDGSGKVLADLIVGAPVPEEASAGAPGKRYVREAGKNRVYATALTLSYSTRFADWVQADLLGTTADAVAQLGIDKYRVEESTGAVADIKTLTITRPQQTPPGEQPPPAPPGWTISGNQTASPAAVANQARLDQALAAVAGLRIVGVRPKPANLAKVLGGDTGEGRVSVADQASLQMHGFYLTGNGQLVANEGQLTVACTDGVVYTLWFGELASDEATKDQAAAGGDASTGTGTRASKGADGRYVMITVMHDERFVSLPAVKPAELSALEAQAAAATEQSPMSDDARARLTNLQAAYKAQSDGFAARSKAGKERADGLAKRFAQWYYVVDAASLQTLRPSLDELTMAAPAQVPSPNGIPAPAVAPATP